MTEETPTPAADDVVVVATQVTDEMGVIAEAAIAAEGDHALIVARFADTKSAIAIYENLLLAEMDGSLHIDGVLVAKADADGRRAGKDVDDPLCLRHWVLLPAPKRTRGRAVIPESALRGFVSGSG